MKKKVILMLSTILVLGVVNVISTVVPGSDSDPIVTKSYVEKEIAALKAELVSNNNNQNNSTNVQESSSSDFGFEVVDLSPGDIITCNASTQIILRTGKAKVVTPHTSGLSDLTAGKDVLGNEYIEANHLLLVPRTDGRGLQFETKSTILLSGECTIEEAE